ncbi:FliI/YscN family ATPase [Paraherbaspirillum soli]|uniref:FliI/YscN family ATPase n=1 Tax=Paraherbaspirillum soli TaxID=631222 RepID=A0ABW0MF15_9BURK
MPDSFANHRFVEAVRATDLLDRRGVVTRIMPTYIEADGPGVPVGSLCALMEGDGFILAEVVKVEIGRVTLMPYANPVSLCVGSTVIAQSWGGSVMMGEAYLGRVVDPLGQPLDGGKQIHAYHPRSLSGVPVSPLDRAMAKQPVQTGIRAIDGLLTIGVGQRVGIFAGSGVGKTTLMTSLTRNIEADCCVLCLVGERGREAEDFWHGALSDDTRSKATMVVATSDQPAVMRARAVLFALTLAEYLREQGKHVLLLLDSVTRFAMALREIGLAAGEPPTVRAYTPGVFSMLPKIVERCGSIKAGGSITAFMTVLTENDDADDPLAETMKSLLDGHIVLSRELAEQGHFPAIHVPRSVSRLFRQVTDPQAQALATDAVAQLSLYESSRTLVESGLYAAGSNPALDRALLLRDRLVNFLRQPELQLNSPPLSRNDTLKALSQLLMAGG